MDRDYLRKMAIEAGFEKYEEYCLSGISEDDRLVVVGEYPCGEALINFAELVTKAERERCATVCEAFGKTLEVDLGPNFAEEIRAS